MNQWSKLFLMMMVVCLSVVTGLMADDNEEKVALEDVPAVVTEAALAKLPGIVFSEAEKETKDGTVIYELEGTLDGKKYEIEVKEDGTVVKVEEEDDDKDEKEGHKDKDDDN